MGDILLKRSDTSNKSMKTMQLNDFTTYKVDFWINNFYLPAVCVGGLLGNLLSLIVLAEDKS